MCKVFILPGSDPAFLDMLDIETMGVLTINDKTVGRQLTSDYSANNRQRNCQC